MEGLIVAFEVIIKDWACIHANANDLVVGLKLILEAGKHLLTSTDAFESWVKAWTEVLRRENNFSTE